QGRASSVGGCANPRASERAYASASQPPCRARPRRLRPMSRRLALLFLLLGACGTAPVSPDASVATEAVVRFDLSGRLDTTETFFDFPFPSDLRLSPDGKPDLAGWPNPRVSVIDKLLPAAEDRPGWPVVPVAYFRFDAPVRPLALD